MIAIKNWAKFQHFKDRKPPWVKLYRDLLDDREWHRLDAKAAKALVMFWLIASESDGELPDVETLAFRLRTTEQDINTVLSKLSHWLDQADITAISNPGQSDRLEERQRREREETEQKARDFEEFWKAYPKKDAKKDAIAAWAKVKVPLATILEAIERKRGSEDWTKAKGQFVPLPATWLNGKRWEDAASDNLAVSSIWHQSAAGVKAKAAELDLDPHDEVMEPFPMFKARVMKAAEAHA